MTIEQIIEWGQSQQLDRFGCAVDTQNHFDVKETETFRRQLRAYFNNHLRNIFGSWRQGYEWQLPEHNAAIGVTNGYDRRFRVFYRPLKGKSNE